MTSPSPPPTAPMRSYETSLCRERLERLLEVLERNGGRETLRQLDRIYAIRRFEALEAERLGWVVIKSQKPRTGRPSTVVQLSENVAAKLPPSRSQIAHRIKHRHWRFAFATVFRGAFRGGVLYKSPSFTAIYRELFPDAKSRAGAASSCSRLLRHPDVFAARQYCYAQLSGEIPRWNRTPESAAEIWQFLIAYGSWRAAHAPLLQRLVSNPR
jgi:hypothetical protein